MDRLERLSEVLGPGGSRNHATPGDEDFAFRVTRQGADAVLSVDAVDAAGRFRNDLQPKIRVVGPGGKTDNIELPQIGPGSYETRISLQREGSYAFHPSDGQTLGTPRGLAYSYPAEYHFYPPDTQKLRAMSEATGGKFQPEIGRAHV